MLQLNKGGIVMKKMNRFKRNLFSLVILAATLLINALGAMGKINNMSQKDVSDLYQSKITPSPFTFSIWSIIYGLLIVTFILLLVKRKDPYYNKVSEEISGLFYLSSLFNILWIISFSYVFLGLSTLLIFAFLITLSMITRRLFEINDGKDWLIPLTFGLYTGWLLIATVVNISATLVKADWGIFMNYQNTWTIFVLVAALFLAYVLTTTSTNMIIPLPIAWAYFGIYQNKGLGHTTAINISLIVGILILLGMSYYQFLYNHHFIVNSTRQQD